MWGHWYPCLELLMMSPLSFKARMGSLIRIWRRLTLLQQFENNSIKYECFSEKMLGLLTLINYVIIIQLSMNTPRCKTDLKGVHFARTFCEGFTVCSIHPPVKYVDHVPLSVSHVMLARCYLYIGGKELLKRMVLEGCQTADFCKQTIIDTPLWFIVYTDSS